jgi:hypothetical protein
MDRQVDLTHDEIVRILGWFDHAEDWVAERGGKMSNDDEALKAKLDNYCI